MTSPISGRIGKSAVTEGALVSNGRATALSTVQQLDPMYVDVTQSSTDFLRLKQELASGALKQENGKAKVKLMLENGAEYAQEGTLEFSDVTVDETTGSITIRALFLTRMIRCCRACSCAPARTKACAAMRCWCLSKALPATRAARRRRWW